MQTREGKKQASTTTGSGSKSKTGEKGGPNQRAANKKAEKKSNTKAENVERNMDKDQE